MHPLIWATLRLTMTGLALILSHNAFAGTFEVAPTTLSIESDTSPSIFYITNRSQEPIVAQVEGYDWHQVNAADQYDATNALIISPPMVRLLPGQQQTVRLMVKPDPQATTERAFRLIVSEIPDPTANKPLDKVKMLLQFSVPVFVASNKSRDTSAALNWKATPEQSGLTLAAHNDSDRHVKIADLDLSAAGRKVMLDNQSFHYILAGADSRWNLPQMAFSSGQTLTIKALDETTNTTTDATIQIP